MVAAPCQHRWILESLHYGLNDIQTLPRNSPGRIYGEQCIHIRHSLISDSSPSCLLSLVAQVCAVVLVWYCCLGFSLPCYVGRRGYVYDVITIAVLAIWCWQLHVSRCHDISPAPAVLAKGVIPAIWALVLC